MCVDVGKGEREKKREFVENSNTTNFFQNAIRSVLNLLAKKLLDKQNKNMCVVDKMVLVVSQMQ